MALGTLSRKTLAGLTRNGNGGLGFGLVLVSGPKTFALPDLPWGYAALEPYISGEIMDLHHLKHHKTYVDNFNKALDNLKWAMDTGDSSIVVKLQSALKFNGGGLEGGGEPPKGSLGWEIDNQFGSLQSLKQKMMVEEAVENLMGRPLGFFRSFGSGHQFNFREKHDKGRIVTSNFTCFSAKLAQENVSMWHFSSFNLVSDSFGWRKRKKDGCQYAEIDYSIRMVKQHMHCALYVIEMENNFGITDNNLLWLSNAWIEGTFSQCNCKPFYLHVLCSVCWFSAIYFCCALLKRCINGYLFLYCWSSLTSLFNFAGCSSYQNDIRNESDLGYRLSSICFSYCFFMWQICNMWITKKCLLCFKSLV
ncbi:putative superoxide dismutase [Rosa chinensis]|uniref:superoxide dismutase n=1 Tax=Rosa chinensis TaxID=74649 RepID=A0A2P6QKR4_ROSCH|nr:putative superoxide dismutase [Rosa chinensis]